MWAVAPGDAHRARPKEAESDSGFKWGPHPAERRQEVGGVEYILRERFKMCRERSVARKRLLQNQSIRGFTGSMRELKASEVVVKREDVEQFSVWPGWSRSVKGGRKSLRRSRDWEGAGLFVWSSRDTSSRIMIGEGIEEAQWGQQWKHPIIAEEWPRKQLLFSQSFIQSINHSTSIYWVPALCRPSWCLHDTNEGEGWKYR